MSGEFYQIPRTFWLKQGGGQDLLLGLTQKDIQ